MALPTGLRLGPYEIVSPLGAGGMGEVYRARDTRLERTVAIKVLPAEVASSPERRTRFEREAKAVSSLNHPHICTLHDVGEQDGVHFLVMEYLEGETLGDRLKKGPLPTDQVLRYAVEIADALDKAHRHGVVHRDLKPGNIMLTKSGAKLLDFGLAKLKPTEGKPAASVLTELPTAEKPLTGEGTILGTFQYMAPEQLEGKEADARADIWALGTVVYEMSTGKRAFTGKSQASLIAAILEREPEPISTLQPMAPPALDRVVKICLAKDPDERWQNAHDLMNELRWIAEAASPAGVSAAVLARRRKRETVAWGALAAAVLVIIGLAAVIARLHREPGRVLRFSVSPPEKAAFQFQGIGGPIAVSPDGRRLAFVASIPEGKRLLWVRPLDSLSAQALPGTEEASFPFWSPDSRFLGFFADGKLKRIDASGGPALTVCDAPEGRGGTWGRDGVILFALRYSPIYRVAEQGGAPVPVTVLDPSRGDTTHRWPEFLPDGRRFLYLASPIGSASEQNAVFAGSIDGKDSTPILQTLFNVAHASGHLLFLRERTLMAQRFDPGRLRFTGEAFPVAERVQYDEIYSRAFFAASQNGVLAYQPAGPALGLQLLWFDRSGKQMGSLGEPVVCLSYRISPDGQRVAATLYDTRSRTPDIWVYELSRGVKTRFTFGVAQRNSNPVWSPDGRRILYAAYLKGGRSGDLFVRASDGTGQEELVLESGSDKTPEDWSPDGRFLAYSAFDPRAKTKGDLWILPLTGERKPFPFLQTEFNEAAGQFSPDGHWLLYWSDETGRPEVYLTRFPERSGKWQISTSGGTQPRWRRDGREVFYVSPDRKLMAVVVRTGPTVEVEAPVALFQTPSPFVGTSYAPAANGQRFLVKAQVGEESAPPISVIVNWTADLGR